MNAVRRRRTIVAIDHRQSSASWPSSSASGCTAFFEDRPRRGTRRRQPARDTIAPTTAAVAEPRPLAPPLDSEGSPGLSQPALFTWDTRSSGQDPLNGRRYSSTSGMTRRLRGWRPTSAAYLPSPEQWEQLSTYGTRQWLDDRLRHAFRTLGRLLSRRPRRGSFRPGRSRTRSPASGIAPAHGPTSRSTTESAVTFTVFIACPRAEDCRLLRLSRLDEPLE